MDNIKNQFNNSTLNNPVFNYGTKSIKKHLGNLPILPEIFLGRADDLQKIHNLLFLGDNLLLLVNGVGGIGKTTVASYYYATYVNEYKHLAMVFAEKSIADALLSLAIYLEVEFEQNASELERINKILIALAELEKPCLLIIDNANNLNDLDKWYPYLRSCSKLHLLLTTRISRYENAASYQVNALNDADAKLLFKKHYRNYNDSEDNLLQSILVAIGYNTLVIELLAKNLNNFNNILRKNYTLSDLLDDIQKKGVLALTKSANVKTDYKLNPAKPEEIIEAMYSVGELTEPEKQMLSVLAVLPAEKIPFGNMVKLLPSVTDLDRLLLSLAQKGWIEFDENLKSFKCSPVIQEIIRKQNKNSLNIDCQELTDSLTNLMDYDEQSGHLLNVTYIEGVIFASYAEMVCNILFPFGPNISILYQHLGSFFANYGNINKALKYFENHYNLSKKLFESNSQNEGFKKDLANSYKKLGNTNTSLGNLNKALKLFEDSTILINDLYGSNPKDVGLKYDLAISYNKLGETQTSLGNIEKAFKYFEESTLLIKELFESNPKDVNFKYGLAISYKKLGETHTSFGNFEKSFKYFEDFNLLTEELYKSNPQNVSFKHSMATSFNKLGETYISIGNFDKALKCFEDDLKLSKELYESNPHKLDFKNGLAVSFGKLGESLTNLGNIDKALNHFEDFSKLMKELYKSNPQNVGFKNNLAASFSKLGETHSSLGNLDLALKFFEESFELIKELYESNFHDIVFKHNLAVMLSKLGETHSILGNFEKALRYFENSYELSKELSESNPQNISFKNSLASSFSKLGETHKAIGNLDIALKYFKDFSEIMKKLNNLNPKNVRFKNGLAISYEKLGIVYTSQGNLNKALKYFEKRLQLGKELFESNPLIVEYKNNLAISYEKLGETHTDLGNLDKALKYFKEYH